jgi:hypothetical protein
MTDFAFIYGSVEGTTPSIVTAELGTVTRIDILDSERFGIRER